MMNQGLAALLKKTYNCLYQIGLSEPLFAKVRNLPPQHCKCTPKERRENASLHTRGMGRFCQERRITRECREDATAPCWWMWQLCSDIGNHEERCRTRRKRRKLRAPGKRGAHGQIAHGFPKARSGENAGPCNVAAAF